MDSELKKKILTIQLLAANGADGERQNAGRMLDRLMKKHDLTLADIEKCKIRQFKFNYKTANDRKLLLQIASCYGINTFFRRRAGGRVIWIECTEDDAVSIRARHLALRPLWEEEVDKLYRAFIHKHNIFPERDPDEPSEPCPPVDPELLAQLLNMMAGMSDAPLKDRKALTKE